MNERLTPAIKVTFLTPPKEDGKRIYYFGSLKDIFFEFTDEQIGTKLNTIWNNHKVRQGEIVKTRTCEIKQIYIIHHLFKNRIKK